MGRRKKPRIVEGIAISGIADKGMSVGRDEEGQVYFLQGGIPGDEITAVITRKKKGVPFGKVKEVTKESIHKADPFCEHFGVCGGCKWQNLDYNIQLQQKEQQVRDAIKRIAKVKPEEFLEILGNEEIKEYRNKLEFSFSNKRWLTEEEVASGEEIKQTKALGFHRPGVFDKIVEINHCHLQNDLSNKIRNKIRELTSNEEFEYYDIRNQKGFLREVVIRSNSFGEFMIILICGDDRSEKISFIKNELIQQFPQIKSFYHIINQKPNSSFFDLEPVHDYGAKYLREKLGETKYLIGPKSFFQTKTNQAKRLYDIAKNFADIQSNDIVYDLYTGLGSIALYVADQCKSVVGIEEIEEAINIAKLNAAENNSDHAVFYAGDVKDILNPEFIQIHGKADLIITDPPRAGMHKDVVNMLLEASAPKIVYISCNPSTQARDISILSEKYDLIKIQPVDMFPHTHHVESVALLKLRK